jgi:hypothetical protein
MMAPLKHTVPGRVARTFPPVLFKSDLSSEIAQLSFRNSKVRSVAMGDPAYRQALTVHSALDLKAGVWDGPRVEK